MARLRAFRTAQCMILFTLCSVPQVALGITSPAHVKDADSIAILTTTAAVRAVADVQVRRIRSLIISKKTDDERDYDRLEKYQRELRGER